MSKKFLKIAIPVALSIAAPGIGTALGVSSSLGTAALGAGLGAAGSALTGGGLKGALLGAAGGGLGGYFGSGGSIGGIGGSASGLVNPNVAAGSALTSGVGSSVSGLTGATGGLFGGASSSFGDIAKKGVGALSNLNTSEQSDKALKQQLSAQQKGIAALDPYAQTGQSANAQLAKLLGLDPNADANTIQDALRNTPGYQFQLDQGTQALDRSAAARGGLFSGRAAKELQQFGQGLGDQTYQSAVSNLRPSVSTGLNAASGQAGIYDNVGDLQANNTMNKANLMNDTLSGFFGGEGEDMVVDPRTGKKVPRSQLGQ